MDGPILAQYCTDSTITTTNRTAVKSTMPSVCFLLGMRQCTRAAGPSRAVAFKEGDAVVVDTEKVNKSMDP